MVARVIDHPFSAGVIPTPYNPDPALLAIVEIIRDGLIRDHHVRLHKFGTFRLRWSKERRIKHPKTGEPVTVPPAPKITFTPAKQLREWIEPNPKPVVPLNEPLSAPLNEPVQSSLQETVQDIIDEQYEPPASPTVVVNAQTDIKPETESHPNKPDSSNSSYKKVALGLFAAVPLMIALLQADFTTDAPDTKTATQAAASSNTTPITASKTELTASTNQNTIIRTESITPGTQTSTESSTLASARGEPVPKPFHMSPQLHTIQQGENLWKLAEEFYGDALLWPHIYRANMRTVSDPDKIISGKQLVIPGLQQPAESLSRNDKALIAEGYFHVYQFNAEKNSEQAIYFLISAKQYSYEWLKQKELFIPERDWEKIR